MRLFRKIALIASAATCSTSDSDAQNEMPSRIFLPSTKKLSAKKYYVAWEHKTCAVHQQLIIHHVRAVGSRDQMLGASGDL
ncbi:hypothetical protein [Sphingobacterium sp.]|uniref:hypothetical protein n=1 Tax=Sphingobacterium sp. TaxID=341027 RepID=UPI0028A75989|nr:hypothetical protein [Sphingobacterium sp.]